MEDFLVSTALAFIVYQIIAYIRPAVIEHFVESLARVIGRERAAWPRRLLFFALALLILYLLFELHWPLHVDTSRTRVNIVTGFFCGPLLAIWINSVLNSPADKGLSKGQIVGGCALAALAVVGSVGDNGAQLLQHYASNINSLSVAGAALQFGSNSHRDATPGAPSNVPAGSTGAAVASSQGLQYASNLAYWFINNDIDYLKLIQPADPAADKALAATYKFGWEVIEPPLRCLFAWQRVGTDPVSVTRHLRDFAEAFRYLRLIDNDDYRAKFATAFANQTALLATDAVPRPRIRPAPPPPLTDDPCDALGKLSAEEVKNQLRSLPKDEYEQRPYLAIAYAGLLAQLNHYAAATGVLTNWLEKYAKVRPEKPSQGPHLTAADWLEIRARSILAAFTEEWVEGDEANIATPVRDVHLSNMESVLKKLKIPLNNSHLLNPATGGASVRFVEPGTCALDEKNPARRLFTAYVTTQLGYWQNTLLHPDYDKSFARQTSDGLAALVQTDVSCVSDGANLLYAQILGAYAHNAILYTGAKHSVESDNARTARLANALEAAQLGEELAKRVEKAITRDDTDYFARIARNDAQETRDALRADANYLEKLKGE